MICTQTWILTSEFIERSVRPLPTHHHSHLQSSARAESRTNSRAKALPRVGVARRSLLCARTARRGGVLQHNRTKQRDVVQRSRDRQRNTASRIPSENLSRVLGLSAQVGVMLKPREAKMMAECMLENTRKPHENELGLHVEIGIGPCSFVG